VKMGKQAAAATGGGAKKKLPSAPLATKSKKKAAKNPLFEKTPKNWRIGGDIDHPRDYTRFVKWPKNVRLQRMRRVLMMRLRVPPSINQFSHAVDKNQALAIFRLCKKYQPETKQAKKARLLEQAQAKKDGQDVSKNKKPLMLKSGFNHVTRLIEDKKAQLVLIAHDVNPIELVMFMPTLCRKKDVPYAIVKGKARLGQLVHKKNASCIAITGVRKEDQGELSALVKNLLPQFNENVEIRRRWGGGIMGYKCQYVMAKREKEEAAERAKKMGLGI